jgi:hypothetical protein
MRYYISPPPTSPLARLLGSIFAVLVIAGAIVFGLFVLAAAVGLGLLLWTGMAIRGWWLRRKGLGRPPGPRDRKSETIEAEYTVISRRRD